MRLSLEECQQEARWSDFTTMFISAPGTLALISGTSWAPQWLIGALPAGWVWTRHTGGGVPIIGDAQRQLSDTVFCGFFCVHVQFGVFPTSTLWCLSWLSCLADLLWALGHFQLFPSHTVRGGPHPFSPCECTNSYFLPLETFARVRRNPCHWIGWIHVKLKVERLFRASACLCGHWF